MKRLGGWCWFETDNEQYLDRDKCGKWMHFFSDQAFAQGICQKAIDEQVCYKCKCTDMELTGEPTGVICFYLNGDDIENHKRVISFMMANNLIQKNRDGKYYNISFKYDAQTRAGDYSTNFKGQIKLEQFIDLQTGKWIC